MPEEVINKLINKTNTGFPDYLDFDRLRREGIDYLGRLSGKIWTDHNVHDPGITILETLCYAMIDLGYRNNLPVADIFTKNPDEQATDNNFFTPAQILTNNPLTITDFRKLLIDIPGVKNAWLEVARDFNVEEFCIDGSRTGLSSSSIVRQRDICCDSFVNGLYHVYVDLEKNLDKETAAGKAALTEKITQFVRDKLLAHRNFCEDFLDITILCKLELGVCADIELDNDAIAEDVYLQMAEKLYRFFSPAPVYYTLPQLLEKGKNIEEIFAGRPLDIKESHGFVDTEEFENLRLRKEIHLSDVYNVLLQIKGVKRVQHLKLRRCDQQQFMQADRWKFVLPENHVPEFSIKCSGFRFSRYSIPISFNAEQYEAQIEINASQNGKILYNTVTPYLDLEIPRGVYRKDIDQYYSVQNEFPRVYGIAEGGLADNVSNERKAKALQLKGYLLFFDQLLANFLSQLKNIRSLFAFSSPSIKDRHSYFINEDLSSVPGIDKLLRFSYSGKLGSAGIEGTTLARPVNKTILLQLVDEDKIKHIEISSIPVYEFSNLEKANIAVHQLEEDFLNGAIQVEIVEKDDECVFFYLISSSECFVLLSNTYYKNSTEARRAAETVTYIGNFKENFRVYVDSQKNFSSFDIEFNLSGYAKYLQLITESDALFLQRRSAFLDHLMSRFAEQFTDFALLSYGDYSQQELQVNEIRAKENYLMNYPVLSADRGRGYDYRVNGWNNSNLSGFEKRFKALTSIKNPLRNSLCNFEVTRYNSNFIFSISIAGRQFFKSQQSYSSKEEAKIAIGKLLQALGSDQTYKAVFDKELQQFRLLIGDIPHASLFKFEQDAMNAAKSMKRMFTGGFASEDVFVSSYKFNPRIINHQGEVVRVFHESSSSGIAASTLALKNINKINDVEVWKSEESKAHKFGKLLIDKQGNDNIFIDTAAFKINIDNTIVGKPEKYSYELLDTKNSFKLRSDSEFDDEKSARTDSEKLMMVLANEGNYKVNKIATSGKYSVSIVVGDRTVANLSDVYESEISAKSQLATIREIVNKAKYILVVHQFPDSWKYRYAIGYEPGNEYYFISKTSYKSQKEAAQAGGDLNKKPSQWEIRKVNNTIELRNKSSKKEELVLELEESQNAETNIEVRISNTLDLQRQAIELARDIDGQSFDRFISIDDESQQGLYVYRLIDKDKLYAKYLPYAQTEAEAETLLQSALVKGKAKLSYLDIVLKGCITIKRKNLQDGSEWFHFQVKTVAAITKPGDPSIAKSLVLLESARGYTSEKDAAAAFRDRHLELLELGVDKDSYLKTKKIHAGEFFIHNDDPCSNTETVAFVPKDTLDYLGAYEEKAIDELIILLKQYPVKRIFPVKDCKEFHERFKACEDGGCEVVEQECLKDKKPESPVYYYSIFNRDTNREEWQSNDYFETVEEAWNKFQFLLLLLKYRGNYFIDCACISRWNENNRKFEYSSVFQVFIREVLAESARRFPSEAEAWGRNGVQRFIDTAQSENSFHTHVNTSTCCYSYYVACKSIRLYHPCKYNTPEQRDRVAANLYKELSFFNKWQWDKYCSSGSQNNIINDFEGNPLAIVQYEGTPGDPGANYFEWYANLLNRISERGLCIIQSKLFLYGKSISFAPVNGSDTDLEKLKSRLTWLSTYFPFTQKITTRQGQRVVNYCMEIKLPGFDGGVTDDCDSNNEKKAFCYVAWKSDCCYQGCNAAIAAFRTAILLLSDFRNYRFVYDCICNSYGIELHFKNTLVDNANNECGYMDENGNRVILPCENEIVAYNPQCYNDAASACEAVKRSLELVNEEGLHVVEHILLRPRCKDDCECRLQPCPNEFDECKFPYFQKAVDDPCEEEKAICFKPGYDPYSFIATIVLPAWPKRFRDPDKRQLFENILYREAPAHVLLRILWLAPHDFCCFEKEYKKWMGWLGQKKQCIPFDSCSLRDFLFRRQYECLESTKVCMPCENDSTLFDPCLEDRKQTAGITIRERIDRKLNELYCWQQQNCSQYRFISCEQRIKQDDVILLRQPISAIETNPGTDTTKSSSELIVSRKVNLEQENVSPHVESMSKTKFINSRLSKYKKELDTLVSSTKGLKVAVKSRRFIDNAAPTTADFRKLVYEIVEQNADKSNKILTKKRMNQFLEIITWFYLDKWAFNGKDISSLKKAGEVFEYMRQNKNDMLEIYRLWESESLKKYEPTIDYNSVRKLLTGNM